MLNNQNNEKKELAFANVSSVRRDSNSVVWKSSAEKDSSKWLDDHASFIYHHHDFNQQQMVPECNNNSDELGSSEASEKLLNYHDDEIFSFVGLKSNVKETIKGKIMDIEVVNRLNSYDDDFDQSDSEDRSLPFFNPSFDQTSSKLKHSPSLKRKIRRLNVNKEDGNHSKVIKSNRTTNAFGTSQPHSSCESRQDLATNDANSCDTRFTFKETVRINPRTLGGSSDVIGTIDFNLTGHLFATGGIARKIRIYSMESILQMIEFSSCEDIYELEAQVSESHETRPRKRYRDYSRFSKSRSVVNLDVDQAALSTLCTAAKLSSLKWVPGHPNRIGCGDYDGVVAEWDLERGLMVCERDEHSGQRVWSLDYSRTFTSLSASASDDGSVRFWSSQNENSVASLKSPSGRAICSAEFSPNSDFLIAVACADTSVLLYDLRSMSSPFVSLQGHSRAASYVRFMGSERLVSASVDNTVRIWDVSNSQKRGLNSGSRRLSNSFGIRNASPSSTREYSTVSSASEVEALSGSKTLSGFSQASDQARYGTPKPAHSDTDSAASEYRTTALLRGHQNSKNFVGLSVLWDEHDEGLIATGSESNDVVVYHHSTRSKSSTSPIFSHSFSEPTGVDDVRNGSKFVSAVCWKKTPNQSTLVAANSSGIIKVIQNDEL